LLKKGQLSAQEMRRDGRLRHAARRGHKEPLQLQLEKEAAVDARDDEARAPLHYAATNGAQGGGVATT